VEKSRQPNERLDHLPLLAAIALGLWLSVARDSTFSWRGSMRCVAKQVIRVDDWRRAPVAGAYLSDAARALAAAH
jgi:hypothetical protein